MLELDLLRTFVAVVDTSGFTRAGDRVHRTQSTVSQHVRKLEQELGCRLLDRDRTGNAVTPTEEGEVLVVYARRLISIADEARDALTRQPRRRVVRLGITEDFAGRRLTDLLAGFARAHPEVRLDTTSAWSVGLHRALDAGDLDVALIKRGVRSGACLRSWPERLAWVASRDAEITPGPLPLALFPPGCVYRAGAIAAFENAGLEWHVAYVGQGLAGVQAAVASGLGIGLLPQGAVLADHRSLDAGAGLPAPPETELALVVRTGR